MDDKVVNFKNYKRPPHPDKSPARYGIYASAIVAVLCGLLTLYLMYSGNMIGILTFVLVIVALWVMRRGQDMRDLARQKFETGSLR